MDEQEKYWRAKERVDELRGFYSHLAAFMVVIIVLAVLNVLVTPGFYWFLIVAASWGFGLFWHAMGVFVFSKNFGRDWEKRKIKQIMEKNKHE